MDSVLCVPREDNGTPVQSSCLENPMDRGAWWTAVHGVARSRTWLRDFTFTFHFHALEKEMAAHSSVLAWRIPGMGVPGGLPSMRSHRVGHDWSDLAAAAAAFVFRWKFRHIKLRGYFDQLVWYKCSAEWRLFKKRDEWTLKWRTYRLVYVRAFLFFYSILCGDLNGKEILKRGNICICITD